MTLQEILSAVDHTLLAPDATWAEILAVVDDGIKYGTSSVCIPPAFVHDAAKYAAGRIPICTVIGFPNGYSTTKTKVYEAWDAVRCGGTEIDMVANIGWIKSGEYAAILQEINQVKDACNGKLLKVIIETCLLTEVEKIRMCQVVSESKADFIKTSTGFSTGGATPEDIILMKKYCAADTLIKAAGGISSMQDAEKLLTLGASRLGTSRVVKIVKTGEENGKDFTY
ncbi:MAG: deoxyribose-phosphate aldolase [Oscillospiraceae bacterium]